MASKVPADTAQPSSLRGRIRSVSSFRRGSLDCGWQLASTPTGVIAEPDPSMLDRLQWLPLASPGTVAAALGAATPHVQAPVRRLDAEDFWYRCRFPRPASSTRDSRWMMVCEGLATLADVWLNGAQLLHSENMFLAHELALGERLRDSNELLLAFRGLDSALSIKRPRPRWRSPMVDHQQLRCLRTSLLGRTAWTPPLPVVGPWRPIYLEERAGILPHAPRLEARLEDHCGVLEIDCALEPLTHGIERVELLLSRGSEQRSVTLAPAADQRYRGRLAWPHVERWWPHTHGEPACYAARLRVTAADAGSRPVVIELGDVGFRRIELLDPSDFALRVNGTDLFCRGACWMPADVASPHASSAQAAVQIERVTQAGFNMLRVSGATVYPSPALLDACDAAGVLLWQDFMFANMDYPDTPAFIDSVRGEAQQLLSQLAGRPAPAVLCGNSEVAQQAAMWGAARDRWEPPLFHGLLPDLCRQAAPGVPYWPSSSYGGAFPHQADCGTTSYFGIGAYLRPIADAQLSGVRFATECLALANIPEDALLAELSPSGVRVHTPEWKAKVPRDRGAGWDFEDVRDHYFRELFGVEPLQVRYADPEHYVELSRIASAEVFAGAFRLWRSAGARCRGALVWFLQDLAPGAGWGLLDASAAPKSVWYAARRHCQPRGLHIRDAGLNGLMIEVQNECPEPLEGRVELAAFTAAGVRTEAAGEALCLPAHASRSLPACALLEGFRDLSYAYRFGPPAFEVLVASLIDAAGAVLARDFHFPLGHRHFGAKDPGLTATASRLSPSMYELALSASRPARFVHIRAPGFSVEDQYFHLAPGLARSVRLQGEPGCVLDAEIHALGAPPLKVNAGE